MKLTSLSLTGRELCAMFYTESLQSLFDHQLPPLDTIYAFFVIRDISWKRPGLWDVLVFEIVPMEPLIVAEEDMEFHWLLTMQSSTERIELRVLVQTDSSNPHCYSHFVSSLQLNFDITGNPQYAVRCVQRLKELLKTRDASMEVANCKVEGWAEGTVFYPVVEHDIRKIDM